MSGQVRSFEVPLRISTRISAVALLCTAIGHARCDQDGYYRSGGQYTNNMTGITTIVQNGRTVKEIETSTGRVLCDETVSSAAETSERRDQEERERKEREEQNLRIDTLGQTLTFAPSEDVVDIDGNRYRTVRIGSQVWMAENLRVTKYIDGRPIFKEQEEYEDKFLFFKFKQNRPAWKELGGGNQGAYCYYDNKSENGGKYGALYNWHAVNTGKLAPKGWHIPTYQEWEELGKFCGGKDIAGALLKADKGWDGNNKSGFGALPAGSRRYNGDFTEMDSSASFWSSSKSRLGGAWRRHLRSGHNDLEGFSNEEGSGYSVRCLKDSEPDQMH